MPRHRLTAIALVLFGLGFVYAEEGKHCFILSGQSNMRQPLPDSFKACVEQVFGKEQVIVVTMGWPSQPIKQWYKAWTPPAGMTDENLAANGSLYDKLLTGVQKATAGKKLASATYIWMQGEADAGSGWGSVYEQSFHGVLGQFKKDLGLQQMNFVVGRINDFWIDPKTYPDGVLVRSVLQKLGESPNGAWIDTDDLNRGVNPWGGFSFEDGHFPPPAYRVMGQRFAYKASTLIDPKRKLDPAIFAERFIDAATQVESHAALGKSLTGTAPDRNYNANGAGLAALTDGKFGLADPSHPAWAGFSPSDTAVEFVIDLGTVQTVETVALNMFISTTAKAQFPEVVTYSTSLDGQTYTINNNRYNAIKFSNGKLLQQLRSEGIKPQLVLLLTEQNDAKARYVKVEIKTGEQWVYIDEVMVNPTKKPPEAGKIPSKASSGR